ncbi:MAG TPA: hypothetical protein VFZ53_07320 [Polyangiaceae bacterium]
MKRIGLLLITLACLLTLSRTADAAWEKWYRYSQPVKILNVHTEVVGGSIAFVAYYLSPTEVVSIANLDRPDMQAIKNALDDAYRTGKRVMRIANRNYSRNPTTSLWYDAADNNVNVTFYAIQGGDQIILRIVP